MNGRDEGGFSERVWDEIDRTIASVKAANCTARRFLEVDGPYGMGLTSVAGDEVRLAAAAGGAPGGPAGWGVPQAPLPPAPGAVPVAPPWPGTPPLIQGPGTYIAGGQARPVPVIASQFTLGIRSITAYETGCQPLNLCPAVDAARDVALEEERLIYYGSPADPAPASILTRAPLNANVTVGLGFDLFDTLHTAVNALALRGYAGPFALTVSPALYRQLYSPVIQIAGTSITSPHGLVDLIKNMFRGGIYMAPVIQPQPLVDERVGAIVTLGRAYSRLVVGQDWYTDYRGRDGVLHNFVLMSSLQFQVCDPLSIQVLEHLGVLHAPYAPGFPPTLLNVQ